ncbi:MerR family transcriptional regulator [Nocardioides sp.]|uniref:MerR family transcriptional regulator n=1 Tax=Nocardioides sp. TaxID=35761 RepID=UPI0027272BB0|nr:MerR family transcriptional regulator [Nocardioides sp.]MDO9458340.1 MerR family transcriptional regulator [Nocardioides sp.]
MTISSLRPTGLGIREVSERTGLSVDTLRWYEKEGLLPPMPRGGDGRRVYPERMVEFVELVVALRRTGLSVADTRSFVELADEGAASHGRRMALLERQREDIHEQQRRLAADLAAVDTKITHYRELIAAGLDCDGLPVDETTAVRQRRTA